MSSFRSTTVFALLIAVFSGYVYFSEFKGGQEEEARKESAKSVFVLNKEEIGAIEIFNRKLSRKVLLKKENGKWQVKAPKIDQADEAEMIAMISTLTTEKAENVVGNDGSTVENTKNNSDKIDWKEFGLDNPAGEITVRGGSKGTDKIDSISIGTVKSFDGKVYIRSTGKSLVRLTSSAISGLLERTADQLRDKSVLRIEFPPVKNLTFFGNGKAIYHLMYSEKEWKLDGVTTKLDSKKVNSLLSDIEDLRADGFVVDSASSADVRIHKLKKPRYRFQIEAGDKVIQLDIAGPSDGKSKVMSNLRPIIFSLPYGRINALIKKKDDFKDKKYPFIFEQDKVESIKLATEKVKLELIRSDKQWKLKSPSEGQVIDAPSVSSLLDKMRQLTVREFLGQTVATGLAQAKNRIVLAGEKGETVLELVWGKSFKSKASGGELESIYVRSSKVQEVLTVKVSALEQITGIANEQLLKKPDEKSDQKTAKEKK